MNKSYNREKCEVNMSDDKVIKLGAKRGKSTEQDDKKDDGPECP